MQRFKNILFVNEPGTSKTGTPRAVVELARRNGARLTICDAAYELTRTYANLTQSLNTIRRERLERLMADLDTEGMDIDMILLDGAPFVEVIRQVQRGEHDLVIKNAEPGGLSDSNFQANDMHLMRKCPCPLWIARSDQFGSYRSILAAVDVDPDVPANEELNALVLDLATSLARQSNCALHVAHAAWVHNESMLRGLDNGAGSALADLLRERESLLTDLLAQLDLDGLDLSTHVERSPPSDYILDLAGRYRTDLVVMGTVAQTGIPGFFIGNTAERILSRLRCSALAVKPAGFVTPVV